ncbi:MAG TPA: guanylate kinase [Terriglobales bacterium]|nr:guanylate kinase [Terriglobales bacterium]
MAGILYIISAPSGSGKSTLVNELRSIVPNLEFSISYTTRAPRGSEQNGREYYFITRKEFEDMIANGEFLEYAEVFGNYYGTAMRFLREAETRGNDLLLDIDVQGAAQVKEKMDDAVSIFVLPPSRKVLENRLRNRSQSEAATSNPSRAMTDEVIARRLLEARKEIEKYSKYDYILVNDLLEDSVEQLKAVVLAERKTRSGTPLTDFDKKLLQKAQQSLQKAVVSSDRLREILDSFAPVSG